MRRFTLIAAADTTGPMLTTYKDVAPIQLRRKTLGNPEYTYVLLGNSEPSIATAAHLSGRGAGSKPLIICDWIGLPTGPTDEKFSAMLTQLGSGYLDVLAKPWNFELAAFLQRRSRRIATKLQIIRDVMKPLEHIAVVFDDSATLRATASEFARTIRPFETDIITHLDGYVLTDHGSGIAIERIAKQ